MRRRLATLALMAAAVAAGQVMVDRVAVSFGLDVITLSAIQRQARMSAYMEGKPVEDTPAARRAAAERLIDQALVRREMNLSRYTPIPMEEVRTRLEEFREKLGMTPEQFAQNLAKYGFTPDDFLQELYWQATVLRFIEFRFSPTVQVEEDEIRAYYEQTYAPRLRQMVPDKEPPPVDEVRERILGILSSQKENVILEQWLGQARQQARIRYHEEAFR